MNPAISLASVQSDLSVLSDFPILSKVIYLDNAATTQKPKAVTRAITKFYEEDNANVHRGVYTLSQKATLAYEAARKTAAQFINAAPEEIIFTRGTTESLNLLATSLGKNLKPGEEIILTEMEHHSNLVPWQQLAHEKKAVVKFIPITPDFTLDMKKAQTLITSKTKIVSVAHISNMLGTINPVKELAKLAHRVGAVMIVDGAQSVPHMKIDVQELGCDFLAFSGHKMLGPTGIGVLYGKKKLLEAMSPFNYGGDMIREVTYEKSTWNDIPWKFEAGTPHIAGAIGLAAAIEYLQTMGMKNIQQHDQQLTMYALEKLSRLPGITIIGPRTNRGPVISFTVAGIHPHDVSEILDRERIAIRGGHHCVMPLHTKLELAGTCRASFYLYNTTKDIDALITGLQQAQRVFR